MTGTARTSGPATSGVMPLYFKIFMVLQREILNGDYPEDTALPAEQALAQRFDVSRVTIRHTMAMLARDGLISRRRGKGTFALARRAERAMVNSFDGLNRNIAEFEAETQVTVLHTGAAPLPHWARDPGDAPADDAMRIVRVRGDEAGPFSYSACFLTARAAALIDASQLGHRTVISTLEDAGLAAARVEQRLTAIAADPEIAGHLHVEAGAPLILMRRTMFDAAGEAFEFLEVHYRPDRFEYSVNLTREVARSGPPRWVSKRPDHGPRDVDRD